MNPQENISLPATEKANPPWKPTRRLLFISTIVLICAIGFIASDIYLPALPSIAAEFAAPPVKVQMTMSSFLISMAIFQVFIGSFSDKFGRKKLLMSCMLIFSLASWLCHISQTLEQLIFFRCLQAIGACGGMTIGQAIVADFFDSRETARILSLVIPLVAFSPAIAPVLGGYVELHSGWRNIFLILCGYGLLIGALIWSSYLIPNKPPSVVEPQQPTIRGFDPRQWKTIISDKRFFGYALFMMSSNTTYFAFIAAAPFLLQKFGYSAADVGYALCLASFPYMGSSFLGRWLSKKRTHLQIIFIGLALNILGGLILLDFYKTGWQHMLALMIPVFVITIGNGLIMPFSSANAMALFPKNSGLVTGTLGSAQLTAAALATAIVGYFENGTLKPLAFIVLIMSLLSSLYYISIFGRPFRWKQKTNRNNT